MRSNNKILGRRRTENAELDCTHCMQIRRFILKSIVTAGAVLFGSSMTSSHAATQIGAKVKKPVGKKDEWWKTDPYARGPGIGIVIHEKDRNTWVVARVFRGSPAARAGIRKGDRIKSINKHSYKSGNLVSLISAVRRNKSRKHTVEIMRPGGKTAIFSVGSASMTRMIARNFWPNPTGGICYYCKRDTGYCMNTMVGYAGCSCTVRCGTA